MSKNNTSLLLTSLYNLMGGAVVGDFSSVSTPNDYKFPNNRRDEITNKVGNVINSVSNMTKTTANKTLCLIHNHPLLLHLSIGLIFSIIYILLLRFDKNSFDIPKKNNGYMNGLYIGTSVHTTMGMNYTPASVFSKIIVCTHSILVFLLISGYLLPENCFN